MRQVLENEDKLKEANSCRNRGMQNSVTKILEGRTSRIVHCESSLSGRGAANKES